MLPLAFPVVDVPEGWTIKDAGPRRWLLPPGVTQEASGARIVLVPLIPRQPHISVKEMMEESLRLDLARFPNMRKTPFEEIQADSGLEGLKFQLAILKDGPEGQAPDPADVREWRACVAYGDETVFYSLFLQGYPEWYQHTVTTFWAVARSVRRVR